MVKTTEGAIEQRLGCHIAVLDSVFYRLLKRSAQCPDPNDAALYLELALKYQDALRKTSCSIVAIKKPKPTPAATVQTYIEQQLNQLITSGSNDQQQQQQRMDTREKAIAGREDPPLAAVDAIDRSQVSGGQVQGELEFAE